MLRSSWCCYCSQLQFLQQELLPFEARLIFEAICVFADFEAICDFAAEWDFAEFETICYFVVDAAIAAVMTASAAIDLSIEGDDRYAVDAIICCEKALSILYVMGKVIQLLATRHEVDYMCEC